LLTGWIEETEAAYFTSNSDVLIFPTFFPEGFPMALFNSMAAGLSIITTPTRAANDYLVEPENCLWVEPKSSVSIITALEKLLNNANLMKEMRFNNKQKSHLFTKDVVAKELSAIFNSIEEDKYEKAFQEVRK
jgi:glycosyltransferase involved in cell wall biosynthesis